MFTKNFLQMPTRSPLNTRPTSFLDRPAYKVICPERWSGDLAPCHTPLGLQPVPSWTGGLPCQGIAIHATHKDSNVMSAANGSVWKEDVDLPPITPALCHLHVLNGRHVWFLSVRSCKTLIAAVVATRFPLFFPTAEEAEYRESCHDAAGHRADCPDEHHEDEFEELQEHAEDADEYPRRPDDEDLQDGDLELDEVPQDGGDRDEELDEEG